MLIDYPYNPPFLKGFILQSISYLTFTTFPLENFSPEPHSLDVSWTLVTKWRPHYFTISLKLHFLRSHFCPAPAWQVQVAEKTNGKVLRFIVNWWSPTSLQLARKWHQLAGSKMGTMGNVCSWFLHLVLVEWTVRKCKGSRPVRINYQHQRQLLSFAPTCQPQHRCQRHQYPHLCWNDISPPKSDFLVCLLNEFWRKKKQISKILAQAPS